MNERNAAALTALIRSYRMSPERAAAGFDPARDLAEYLVGQSVLVPSAMTDEEATLTPPFDGEYLSISKRDQREAAGRHRAALEKIAKGE